MYRVCCTWPSSDEQAEEDAETIIKVVLRVHYTGLKLSGLQRGTGGDRGPRMLVRGVGCGVWGEGCGVWGIANAPLSPPDRSMHYDGQSCRLGLFNISFSVEEQGHNDTVHEPRKLSKRKESQSGEWNSRPSAYQPNALPLGQPGSLRMGGHVG